MQRTFLDDLDDNCITHILRKLSPLDVFSVAGTCRVRASASAAGGTCSLVMLLYDSDGLSQRPASLPWLQRCRDIIQDGRLALVVSRRGRSSRSLYRHVYDTLQEAVDDSRCGSRSQ